MLAYLLLAFGGSYLVGSIPTAYLVVKWLKRIDVRTIGSGNVGTTNVTRVAGLWAGLSVFLIDFMKGLIAVGLIAPWVVHPLAPSVRLGCGVCAVVGHVAPVFLGFRGGKGVATTVGVLVGTMPMVAGAFGLVWLGCCLIWRYVSLGSIAAAVMIPIAQVLTRQSPAEFYLGLALALLIVVKHRSNVERLLQGREHRVGSQETK